jgi:CRP-like cAMP-binding protein
VSDFTPDEVDDESRARSSTKAIGGTLGYMEVALQLKSVDLFSGLEMPVLMQLAQVVRAESFEPGAVIVREDDYADCIYLVIEGVTRVTKGATLLAELGTHSFFGELALLGGGTRMASVQAKDHVRVLRLDRKDLFRMMDRYPQIAIEICLELSRRIRALNDRVRLQTI